MPLWGFITAGPTDGLLSSSPAAAVGLRVEGGRLTTAAGTSLRLVGFNRSGTEYACAQGWGIFDGPAGPDVAAEMRSWDANVVRIPLNEDCWLGINLPAPFTGATYRAAIEAWVARLNASGLSAVLDLHWSAPGREPALGQQQMPDASHAIAFWRSVATAFASNPDVAFELYNEPHGVSWSCWRSGCVTSQGWRAVGMQRLVTVVRDAGARQPIIVDGLDWANDLSGWLAAGLRDPDHQLAAGFHVYPWTACSTAACWNKSLLKVGRRVPVVATEVGEKDCRGAFVNRFLRWSQAHDVSALAWTWNDNEGCLSMLTAPASGMTTYGSVIRSDLLRAYRSSGGVD